MSQIPSYALSRTLDASFDEAEARVRQALQEEGFGILTEIDVRETFRKKLDVAFRPYRILGACAPTMALQALNREEQAGLLLPCNVVVYQGDEEGRTTVAILDPRAQLAVSGNPELAELGAEVRSRMERVLAAL
jgi:uncharacterized protein (DUF302 family)